MLNLMQTLHSLRPDERYAIDTETTGLRPWGDTVLRGVSLYARGQAWYYPVSHPGGPNQRIAPLREAIAACQAMPILHNGNYDRAILERAGITLPSHYRDTQILAWMQDENRPKALKKLGETFFGMDAAAEQKALKALMRGESKTENYKRLRDQGLTVADAKAQSVATRRTWADLTAQEIGPYAEQDARLTYYIYDVLLAHKEYGLVECAVQRMHDLQDVVYRMVRRGIQIDPSTVSSQRVDALARMDQISSGFAVNLDSPKQLAKLIYEEWGLPLTERTEHGAPSTSRATLEAMAGLHGGLDEILQYRRLGKSVGTYYDPFIESADAGNRIHPSVNVVGTVTGRFSYSDPNLQTIPRDGTISGVKDCFVAAPGKLLVSYDLKSAELRFMASLANEPTLIDALAAERDIYGEVAAKIGVSRQVGKSLVLSWPYGVGPVRFSRSSGLSVKESKSVISGFEQAYPSLSATMSKLSQYAELTGRLPLLEPGRFRRFTSPSLQWPVPGYTALNAACQGGVADTMGNVMIQAEAECRDIDADLVLQVHDSLVFEAVPGTEELLGAILQRVLDEVNPLSMPLVFKMAAGI